MREPRPVPSVRHIGVMGACGGAGASSMAAALARARVRAQDTALVDLADSAGGLDVLLGVEELPGVRWADLGAARGEVSGQELAGLLPTWGDVAVLSTDRSRPTAVSEQSRDLVLAAAGQVANLVIDVGGSNLDVAAGFCDQVFIVVPRQVRAVAGAQALIARLVEADLAPRRIALIVRGPAPGGLDPLQVERVLETPLATHLGVDRGLAAAVERGVGPQGRRLDRGARRALAYMARNIPGPAVPQGSKARPVFGRAA